jgi:hypothetical protein
MAKRKKNSDSSGTALKSLVTVAFAEDVDLATQYKELLNDNDIPAAIKTRPEPDASYQGIAVMVPEDYLDEAHVLIEDQNSIGDFYDLAFNEDDYDDTDKGYYGNDSDNDY